MLARIELEEFLTEYCENSKYNIIEKDVALNPACENLRMYEPPIIGISAADDTLFGEFKNPNAIGEHYLLPEEWIDGAKSVISIFNPFTEIVKKSNIGGETPSDEWLHARIDGQTYIVQAALALAEHLKAKYGLNAVIPALDSRFQLYGTPKIYSNWSERHAAYVSGLGTFSLNRALITSKGIAGRFCSIIIDWEITPDKREYTGLYEYCVMCGACQSKCPVEAINGHGKSHIPCMDLLDKIRAANSPYYGCGKCQAGMPCESRIPKKNKPIDYSNIQNYNNTNDNI